MIAQNRTKRNEKRGRPATGQTPRSSYRFDNEVKYMLRVIAERTAEGNESLALRQMIHEKADTLGIVISANKKAHPARQRGDAPSSRVNLLNDSKRKQGRFDSLQEL